MFFRKIRSYEEGKCKGKSIQLDNLPEIRDHWERMYEWIIVLIVFIDKMKREQSKDVKTKRMKFVLYVAAGVGIREVIENLVDPQKESGEDFARRILAVLKQIRKEKLRNKEEEDNKTKENGLEEYSILQEEKLRQRRTKRGTKVNKRNQILRMEVW